MYSIKNIFYLNSLNKILKPIKNVVMVMWRSEAKLARLGHHTMGVAKCRVPTRHLHAPSCGSINLPIHSFQPNYVGLTQRNMLVAPFCECYKIFFLFSSFSFFFGRAPSSQATKSHYINDLTHFSLILSPLYSTLTCMKTSQIIMFA